MVDPSIARHVKPDTTDYARRRRINLIAGAGIVVLIGLSWFAVKMFIDYEKLGNCIASGRKNCVEINAPPRAGVFVPTH